MWIRISSRFRIIRSLHAYTWLPTKDETSYRDDSTTKFILSVSSYIYIYIRESRFISMVKFCLSFQAKQFNFKTISKPKSEFNKFEPQFKHEWFRLKLYLLFRDLSRLSIGTGFWRISDVVQILLILSHAIKKLDRNQTCNRKSSSLYLYNRPPPKQIKVLDLIFSKQWES